MEFINTMVTASMQQVQQTSSYASNWYLMIINAGMSGTMEFKC